MDSGLCVYRKVDRVRQLHQDHSIGKSEGLYLLTCHVKYIVQGAQKPDFFKVGLFRLEEDLGYNGLIIIL